MIWKRAKYYDSIHNCPILYWDRAIKEDNPKNLHISGKYNPEKGRSVFRKIFDEQIKEFGIPTNYKRYLQTMARAANEYVRAYTGERWILPIAQIREQEAKVFLSAGPKQPFSEMIAKVSKAMGFRVDPKTTTIAEFYGYVNSLNGS